MPPSTSVAGGGRGMDEAIIAWCKKQHALLLGRPSAERVKIDLGSAHLTQPQRTAWVKARCLRRGTPQAVPVSAR